MKKGNLFAMALAAFVFASCSSEQDVEKPEVVGGSDTYSAVSISFPQTMGLRIDDPAAANVKESKVTSVGVYIIDDLSGFMHKGLFTSGSFTAAGDKYTLTTAIKTTTGSKSIYVVLNPNATLQGAIDVQKGGIFGDSPYDGTADDAFVSTEDVVMASVVATSTVLTVKSASEALAAPQAITVQRNAAKIAVKKKDANVTVIGGSVDNLQFALLAQSKKSYLVQRGGKTYATVVTPAKAVTFLTADNAYFTKVATPSTWININDNTAANNALNGYYALENVNNVNMVGNTTAAIIKARFKPTDNTVVVGYAANGTRTLGSIVAGASFYVKKSDNTFWNETAYAAALLNGFTDAHFSLKYDAGTSYYRIWVQDASNQKGVLRNNYYVLSVNKITGPGLPYVPGVDPLDPTNPVDPNLPVEEDTYVSVEVTVLPWDVQTSEHEI